MPINTKITGQTFQNFDGTNFTTAGVDASLNIGRGSLGAYAGVGTSFEAKSTGAILDFKGSMPYGNSPVSGGFRIRHNLNGNSKTVQFRLQPGTVNVPVSDNVSLYATPYGAAKYNYNTNKTDLSAGIFTGAKIKIGNATGFVEGQLYDFTKINNSTMGINAGVSYPIDFKGKK